MAGREGFEPSYAASLSQLSKLISTEALSHVRKALQELEALWRLTAQDGQDELAEALVALSTVYRRLTGEHYARPTRRLIFAAGEPDDSTRERIMERLHRAIRHLEAARKLVPEDEQQPLTEARWAVGLVRNRYEIVYSDLR